MVQWEYKVYQSQRDLKDNQEVSSSDLERLKEFGKQEWELVSVGSFNTNGTGVGFYYFLKKPKR